MKAFNYTNMTFKSKNHLELDKKELMPLIKFVAFMSMFIVISWTNAFLKMFLLLYKEKIRVLDKYFKNYW